MKSGVTHALKQAALGQFGKCYHCRSGQHKARNCPHKDKRCNLHKKVGHLVYVHWSKTSRRYQQVHTHQVEKATEVDKEDDNYHVLPQMMSTYHKSGNVRG